MPRKSTPNSYRIEGDVAYLDLVNRHGEKVAEAIIDTDDLDRVLAFSRWNANWTAIANKYYVKGRGGILLHRFVMNAPRGVDIDHIHHNPLDCRKAELRACSHANNLKNRQQAQSNSVSGIRNVSWIPSKNRWRVCMESNGRKFHIGHFEDLEEAKRAAIEARRRIHGEFAS